MKIYTLVWSFLRCDLGQTFSSYLENVSYERVLAHKGRTKVPLYQIIRNVGYKPNMSKEAYYSWSIYTTSYNQSLLEAIPDIKKKKKKECSILIGSVYLPWFLVCNFVFPTISFSQRISSDSVTLGCKP